MLQYETPFRVKVRGLKSPLSASFVLAEWERVFEQHGSTSEDRDLLDAAAWLNRESIRLRERFKNTKTDELGGRNATLLAVASLNNRYKEASKHSQQSMRIAEEQGAISFQHMTARPIRTGDPEHNVDIDAFLDLATDAFESWLWDAAKLAWGGGSTTSDIAELELQLVQKYSLQRGQHELWTSTLWEAWRFANREADKVVFGPTDKTIATLMDAWTIRQETQFMTNVWPIMADWSTLSTQQQRDRWPSKTAVEIVQNSGQRRKIRVNHYKGGVGDIPSQLLLRSGLEGTYLSVFLDRQLPTTSGLTCDLILKAWSVVSDLANLLDLRLPKRAFSSWANARSWALVVRPEELIETLVLSLAMEVSLASEVIRFLTWSPGIYRGVWGAPIIPIPGERGFCLVKSILETSNVMRRVEAWLHRGGLDDSLSRNTRGDSYEGELRFELERRLSENELIGSFKSAADGVRRSRDFPEQIDLLIQFGELLVVGEVKCLLSPAESLERHRYLRKLMEACDQACRKARALESRRDVVARSLAIAMERAEGLRIVPIVVLNHGFGVGFPLAGCPIVDAHFLSIYLSSGKLMSKAAARLAMGRLVLGGRTLYTNEAEAVQNFESSMTMPPMVEKYTRQLKWTTSKFPTSSGNPLYIEKTQLANVEGLERIEADFMKSVIDDR